MNAERLYLDNAATSWPKPESVYAAVDQYQRTCGAAAGRGNYREAADVERRIVSCRQRLATFIGAARLKDIVWTCNGTEALNLAICGLLKPGDHVITTVAEHNSVLRPLRFLAEERGVTCTYVNYDVEGYVDPADIEAAIQSNTQLVAVVHASNVTGAVQPIEEIGQIAGERGVNFLVDAAQSVGHIPMDVERAKISFLAAPTHKGLFSPLGLGFLYIAPSMGKLLTPLRFGGTGTQSDEDRQPTSIPDRFESGNLNVPAVVGLEAGLKEIETRGLETIAAEQHAWTTALLAGLQEIPGLEIFGPRADSPRPRVAVVSIRHPQLDPREMAAALDAAHGIQVRAGLHCAPKMHAALGTLPTGTVRFSAGWDTSIQDVPRIVEAVRDIVESCV